VSHGDGGNAHAENKHEFTVIRKGYDPAEVDRLLAEYEEALRELEEYAARLNVELKDARREIARLEAAEQESVDRAMLAVFDAKERIMERAMERAREIEDAARTSAGLGEQMPADTVPVAPEPLAEVIAEPLAAPLAAPLAEVIAEPLAEAISVAASDESTDPNSVLEKMLAEAEAIRNRLDSGLAAAFDHMEKLQRDAEVRAADLIADAQREATQLRAAAAARGPEVETAIAVNLSGEARPDPERPSRYSRHTARLPRLGEDGGPSVLATMNGLRMKLRESEDSSS
jgi:cell division septum initiation protein DivIVA